MLMPLHDQYRLKDKIRLILRVNYFTSTLAIVFGLLCYYFLKITLIIPFVIIGYGALNLINTVLYYKHRVLTLTYNISSIMALVTSITVTLYSGGINSPFIFVLAVIVFTGYITTRTYGRVYLNINLFIIVLIYSQSV